MRGGGGGGWGVWEGCGHHLYGRVHLYMYPGDALEWPSVYV